MSKHTTNRKTNKHLNITKLMLVILLALATIVSVASGFMTTEVSAIEPVLVCSKEEHTHSDDCYSNGELTCGKEEHTHDDTCYIDYSETENKDVWEARFSNISLNNDNVTNLLNVANSLVGYQEETNHYILDGNTHKNYSIFGAWNGMFQTDNYSNNLTDQAFQDWNSTFIAFVLNYSHNYDYLTSLNKNFNTSQQLFEQLSLLNQYSTDSKYALAGNIAIFAEDNTLLAGFIQSVDTTVGTANVIVGDVTNEWGNQDVEVKTISLGDIAGYGIGLAQVVEEPVVSEEPVATEAPANNSEEPTQESEDTTTYTTEVSNLQNEINALPTVEEYVAMGDGEIVEGTTVTQAQLDVYNKQSELWDTYYNLEDNGYDLSSLDTTKLMNLSMYFNGEIEYTDGEGTTLDKRIEVDVDTSTPTGYNGETLKVTVTTTSHSSEQQDMNESPIQLKIGKLPEGVEITGFSNNQMIVQTSGNSPANVTVNLKTDENGDYYIEYTMPAGATLYFEIPFASTNGTMPNGTVDSGSKNQLNESVTVTPTIVNGTDKDKVSDSATVKWSGQNIWADLDKEVDKKTMTITDGKLDGYLNYTISAKEYNSDSIGEIWTDYVTITDTLTLPQYIDFPDNVTVNADKTAIVTSTGETIFSLTNTTSNQPWQITDLTLSADKKTVTYTIRVDNPSEDGNGTPSKEMDSINFTGQLNVNALVLNSTIFSDVEKNEKTIKNQKIKNKVDIKTYAYNITEPTYEDSDSVESKPNAASKSKISKSADKEGQIYNPGDEVIYTITIENKGTTDLSGRPLTDTLPKYLHLTDEQKNYIKTTYKEYGTVTFTENEDGTTLITIPNVSLDVNGKKTFTIKATITDDLDDYKASWSDSTYVGLTIQNNASYDGNDDDSTIYSKYADTTVDKGKDSIITADGKVITGDDLKNYKVSDGDKIVYAVTVNNPGNGKSVPITITDDLPSGLKFSRVLDSNKKAITVTDNTATYNVTTANNNTQSVTFKQSGTKLTFDVGRLEGKDSITVYYECEVAVGNKSITTITNTAKSSGGGSGSEDTGVKSYYSFDKTVYEAGDESQSAEGKSYDDGSTFLYKLTAHNDATNPNTDEHTELVDTIPTGMYPMNYADDNSKGYKIYTSTVKWDINTIKDADASKFTEVEGLTFQEYLSNDSYYDTDYSTMTSVWPKVEWEGKYYYTNINGEWVKLGKVWESGVRKLTLTWSVDRIEPGSSTTKSYYAKLQMTDSQKESTEKIAYTNKAKFKGIEDSTTIYSKPKGTVIILKKVEGAYKTQTLTDDQKAAITFKLTKTDSTYESTLSLKDFYKGDDNSKLEYTIKNLPFGEYTIEETSAAIDGSSPEVKIDGKVVAEAKKTFTIDENKSPKVEITFTNKYEDVSAVDIQKSVWSIEEYKAKQYYGYEINTEKTKEYFKPATNGFQKAVIYNITIANSGKEDILLTELIDTMDSSLTYLGLNPGDGNKMNWKDSISTYQFWQNQPVYLNGQGVNGQYNDGIVSIEKKSVNTENNSVTFKVGGDSGYTLKSNHYITFFIGCNISDSAELGKDINNKISLVVDNKVSYKDVGDITMNGTNDDGYQNNGGGYDEGEGSYSETQKLISSDVNIVPIDGIIPGISKNATEYLTQGTGGKYIVKEFTDMKSKQISPQSIVKWEITLYNDGTQPISSYTLKDTIPSPWKLMTKEELDAVTKDANGNTLSLKYTLKIADGEEIDITDLVDKGLNEDGTEFSVDLSGEKYSIPRETSAVLTVYTSGIDVTQSKQRDVKYTTYTNTAQFLPTDKDVKVFYSNVLHGEIIREDGVDIGVKDTDTVFAQGEYGSFSWKSIQDATDENDIAYGYNTSNNYIYVDYDGEEGNRDVIYTNNIENTSSKNYDNIVVTDMMPYKGDTGVINQENRNSDFSVYFTGIQKITITDVNGNTRVVDSNDYSILFSTKTSFEDGDVNGTISDNWHETYDSASDKTFRIVFSSNVVLAPNETLSIQYGGQVSENANPGEIAWNNFSYSYKSGVRELTAEPPKVGVKIKTAPYIKKVVVDGSGNELAADKDVTFEFTIYGKFGTNTEATTETFHLTQGGSLKLTKLTNTNGDVLKLVEGESYTIKETTTYNTKYEFVGAGISGQTLENKNEYTFTYSSSMNNVQIVFKNKEIKQYSLPSTGGMGPGIYYCIGTLLISMSLLCMVYKKVKEQLS